MTPRRPVMRIHGAKYRLAPRIIAHFPPHRVYAEPFGGGAGVLLRKPRSFAEVYNDLDGELVNVFRVMRDPARAARLRELIELTPWAREEFNQTYEPVEDDPVEQARRTIARTFMAFGTSSRRQSRTGFRAAAYRQNSTEPAAWRSYPEAIVSFIERLRGVTLENRDALKIIEQQDDHDTLFYVDPPYPHSTRTSFRYKGAQDVAYAHELDDDGHRRLAESLHGISGMAILSGYACGLYDHELYADWARVELNTLCDGGRHRVEVLWMNDAAAARRPPVDGRRANKPPSVPLPITD